MHEDGDGVTVEFSFGRLAINKAGNNADNMVTGGCDAINEIVVIGLGGDVCDGVITVVFGAVFLVFEDMCFHESTDGVSFRLLGAWVLGREADEGNIDAAEDTKEFSLTFVRKDASNGFSFFSFSIGDGDGDGSAITSILCDSASRALEEDGSWVSWSAKKP